MVCERLGLTDVEYQYTGGSGGWKGDVPTFDYDIRKAQKKGWKFKYDSTAAVKKTLEEVDISSGR